MRYVKEIGAEDTTHGAAVLLLVEKWAEGGHSVAGEIALKLL